MKILFVASGNTTFGINPFIIAQGESLNKNNIRIEYYSIDERGFFSYLKNVIKLKKILLNEKYDIIHAHYALCGIVSFFARKNEKLIVSLMGDDILGGYNLKGTKTISSRIIVFFTKLFAKYFWDLTIVKSKQMNQYLFKNTRSEIIPNGIDFKLFRPLDKKKCKQRIGYDLNKKYILFLSNPDRPEKNFRLANESFSLLKNSEEDLQLVILTDCKYRELPYYYNAAEIVMLTSYSEGSPNVIKEALACNVPVVSTDVGDVKEITKGIQGCYVASFEMNDFSKKLELALHNQGRIKALENIKNLEINSIAKRIMKVYKNIIKGN